MDRSRLELLPVVRLDAQEGACVVIGDVLDDEGMATADASRAVPDASGSLI